MECLLDVDVPPLSALADFVQRLLPPAVQDDGVIGFELRKLRCIGCSSRDSGVR